MAKAANNKDRKAGRGKAKPKRAAALRSTPAALLERSTDRDLAMPFFDPTPATEMFRSMSEVMNAYIEFPNRLMQCRTPFGVWREQVLLAGRLFDLMERGFHLEGSRKT